MLWYQLFLLFWFLFLDISGIMRHVLISPLVRDVWTLPCKHCKPCKACEQAPARAKSHVCEALPGAQLGRNLKVGFLDDLDDDKKISFGNAVSDIIDYSRLIIWWFLGTVSYLSYCSSARDLPRSCESKMVVFATSYFLDVAWYIETTTMGQLQHICTYWHTIYIYSIHW